MNQRWAVAAAQPGKAFVPADRRRLPYVFSIQHERTGNRDNTVSFGNRILPIEKTPWRATLAGCRVIIYKHLDGTLSLGYGPHRVGRYTAEGRSLQKKPPRRKALEGRKWGNPFPRFAETVMSTADV